VSAQPLSGAGTGRYSLLRTLLVFSKRGKPCPTKKLVEMRGNRGLSSQTGGVSAQGKFHNHKIHKHYLHSPIFLSRKLGRNLVVVMTAVEMWKAK
jgi:hypothetical protein